MTSTSQFHRAVDGASESSLPAPPPSPRPSSANDTFDAFEGTFEALVPAEISQHNNARLLDMLRIQRDTLNRPTPQENPTEPRNVCDETETPSKPSLAKATPATCSNRPRNRSRSNSNSSGRSVKRYKNDLLNDENEDMTDNPKIKRYAERCDGLQWGMADVANAKIWEAFPKPKRSS